jgi:hypothetical protein
MVFDQWQNGILVAFIVIGKSQESDLDPIFRTLSKRMPSNRMPNVIIIDNDKVEINLLRFDFPKFTYNSMFITCVL